MRQINLFAATSDELQELKAAMATDPELRAWVKQQIVDAVEQLPADKRQLVIDAGAELSNVEELMKRLLAHGSSASGML